MYNNIREREFTELNCYANYEIRGEGIVYICNVPEKQMTEIVGREVLINGKIKFIKGFVESLPEFLSQEQRNKSVGLLVQE